MKILITLLILIILSPSLAHSQEPMSTRGNDYKIRNDEFIKENYIKQIKEVERYLASFKTLSSRFTQMTPDNKPMSQGRLSISRPAKARWEYTSPKSIVILMNHGKLVYYDKELDQITHADLNNHPLNILLDEKPDLLNNKILDVYDVLETSRSIAIVIAQKPTEENDLTAYESLTLVFSKNPMKLQRMHRVDSENMTTTVRLINPKFDKKLDESLFIFQNPRFHNRKKRN